MEDVATRRARRPPAFVPADQPTRTHRLAHSMRPRPEVVGRIALFTCVLARERARELLEGFSASSAAQAQALAEQLSALDRGAKRARAAREFGERRDAADRVRVLLAEASALGGELASRLPKYLLPVSAAALPAAQGTSSRAPARDALIERLVREAVR